MRVLIDKVTKAKTIFEKDLVSEATAMSYASRKAIVGRALDSIKSERGEKTTTIEELSLDDSYGKKDDKR